VETNIALHVGAARIAASQCPRRAPRLDSIARIGRALRRAAQPASRRACHEPEEGRAHAFRKMEAASQAGAILRARAAGLDAMGARRRHMGATSGSAVVFTQGQKASGQGFAQGARVLPPGASRGGAGAAPEASMLAVKRSSCPRRRIRVQSSSSVGWGGFLAFGQLAHTSRNRQFDCLSKAPVWYRRQWLVETSIRKPGRGSYVCVSAY